MNYAATIDADSQRRRPAVRRPRVLLSACSCCPNSGSEPGVGWGRATEIAKYCDVWVLTKKDGMQPRIEAYLEEHGPIPNLHFVYIPFQPWELFVSQKWSLKYIVYRRWHRRAFRVAKRLHAEIAFDVAHHVTFNGYREPSYLYRLGIPFVWGPVGGAQNYPWRFLPGANMAGAALEVTRSVLNCVQLHTSPRVRTASRVASSIFAANPENKQKFLQVLGAESILMCDAGAAPLNDDYLRPQANSDAIRILWAGNLATWKALELLIEAVALLPANVPYELHVIGDGPRRAQWERLAERKGVARKVRWFGRLPHGQTLEQFHWADVFAFTSLRDTSGTVVLEALAAAKPVICLDHQGVGSIITPQCGIKIPVTSRKEVARQLRDAIALLQRNRRLRDALADGARTRASDYLWSRQAGPIAEEYNRILESAGSDARCDLRTQNDSENDYWQEAPIDESTARV